jgi:hypothetical protein
MSNYSTKNKTIKKGDLKDVDVTVLADGYNGTYNLVAVTLEGHLLSDAYDGSGLPITSHLVGPDRGLDVYVLNQPSFSLTNDTNYGTVGANTLRTASQIGSATGAADFNVGTIGTQTLRTASHTVDGYGNLITSQASSTVSRRGLDTYSIKGTPQHFNGTVGTTATTIIPTTTTIAILVSNPGTNAGGVTLEVSFDGGINFFTIERRGSLAIETEVSSFQIKGSVAGTAYEILVTRR